MDENPYKAPLEKGSRQRNDGRWLWRLKWAIFVLLVVAWLTYVFPIGIWVSWILWILVGH